MTNEAAILRDRAVLRVSGADRVDFLQGLVSADVRLAADGRAVWGALLTAQGKYLHDFFIVAAGELLLLDAEAARLDDLVRRLRIYRLRSKVELAAAPDLAVAVAFGDGAAGRFGLGAEPGRAAQVDGGVAFVDPRLPELGVRLILSRDAAQALGTGDAGIYDRLRLQAGVPDGSRDLEVEKTILLEAGFDELGGIAWDKGCFMGQELTARTKYRGLVKRRLVPVEVDGALPPPGTPVLSDGREVGQMRSGRGDRGLALLRLEPLERHLPLTAGEARLQPQPPAWARY